MSNSKDSFKGSARQLEDTCVRCHTAETWANVAGDEYCYFCFEGLKEKYQDFPDDEDS